MKKYIYIKKIALLLGILPIASLMTTSCTDQCESTQTYRAAIPSTIGIESLKNSIKQTTASELKNPAKIYVFGQYLLISEAKKGIHIIDNTDPKNPKNLTFLSIPGVLDMAVKDNVLYADNYTDLVSFDISDINKIKEIGRLKNMFNYGLHDGLSWYYDSFNKTITDYEWKIVTQKVKTNCGENGNPWPIYYREGFSNDLSFNGTAAKNPSTSGTGTGGSMARFTIMNEYLYAATQSDLLVFGIKNPTRMDSLNKVNLGWGIETIFPYKDKLFIGSNTGMYIYDNKNPSKPIRESLFQHVRACDPVVVENDKAYVTLRTGICGSAPNQLQVVNVSNTQSPFLIKTYEMQNPHGLGIRNSKLFIGEGSFGLKSFDASIDTDIKLKQHLDKVDAYDLIPISDSILLMIGKGGLYQYDYSDLSNLKLLSTIPVKN